jgi:hypothetical protein
MSPRDRLRTWHEGAQCRCVTKDLGTLATALQARIDDELKASPWLAPWRPKVGITPTLSDAELLTLAVMSALLGYTSERRRLRRVDRDFHGLFPYVPQQSGYGKRLRAASSLLTRGAPSVGGRGGRRLPRRAGASRHTMERAMRNPTSSTWKVGWLRRRAEARQLQCSSNQPPPRSTR